MGKSFQMLPVPQISSVGFKFYFLSSMIIFTEYLFCKFCDLIFLLSILWFVFHSMKLYGRNLFRKAASHTNRNRNVIFPYISWYFVSMSFIKNTFSKFWIFAPFKWDDFFCVYFKMEQYDKTFFQISLVLQIASGSFLAPPNILSQQLSQISSWDFESLCVSEIMAVFF